MKPGDPLASLVGCSSHTCSRRRHEHLFGEGREASTLVWDMTFHYTMLRTPVALAAVSEYTAQTLCMQFGRQAHVVPNAIDCDKFFPSPQAEAARAASAALVSDHSCRGWIDSATAAGAPATAGPPVAPTLRRGRRVLLVGNPGQAFKGWDMALSALEMVYAARRDLEVTWVCQARPQLRCAPLRLGVRLRLSVRLSAWSPLTRLGRQAERVHVCLSAPQWRQLSPSVRREPASGNASRALPGWARRPSVRLALRGVGHACLGGDGLRPGRCDHALLRR